MATVTLRNVKGSPLTHTEVDDNFSSLKVGADIAEAGTSDNNPNTLVKRDAGGKTILSTLEATVDIITNSVGPSAAQQHTVPAVASDTLTLNAATQTLTNKTLTSPVITGGSINDTPIGATTRNSGNFTTVDANSTITSASTVQGTRLISTVATGTAPLTVTSTTKVANLNADLLDDMTTASTNTASTIVNRDASGNFAAGTITAALNGNAATATKLATARTISLTGDVTGSASFDGSANAAIAATVAAASQTVAGKIEIATNAEVQAGTDALRAVTPAGLVAAKIVQGTSVAASGTAVDFTGIPSWVKRVTVMLSGVSTNGTSNPQIQLGTSGGVANTGYKSTSSIIAGGVSTQANTTGFALRSTVAADLLSGHVTLQRLSGNIWTAVGLVNDGGATTITLAGTVTLSGELDRIRLTTVNGTDTFDAGTVNIAWE